MHITIKRIRKKGDAIDGHLFIDGQKICDTAENDKSAIKVGTYPVSIIKCKQHARKMPVIMVDGLGMKDEGNSLNPKLSTLHLQCKHCAELECVNNNSKMPTICHQIKAGNGVYHREDGTILVGTYLAPGCLKHPKATFENIYDRIRKSIERGHNLTFTIVEDYPKPPSHDLTPYQMGCQILSQF